MIIAVIDGQGGGIGSSLIEVIRRELGNSINILALGTNALATAAMLKAGANQGATGENAILVNACKVDVIMGCLSIIIESALVGELTSAMAQAIVNSTAKKILLQPNRNNIFVAGVSKQPLPHHIDDGLALLKQFMGENKNV